IVASLPGFGSTTPVGRRPLAQLACCPYFAAASCSPVARSRGEEAPLRDAGHTSLRGRPLTTASNRTGVWAESQSCVSCADVWKYHFILPVSTSSATSEHVKRLSPGRLRGANTGFGLPVGT